MPVRHSVVSEPRKYRPRQMGLCGLKSTGLESETALWETLWASGGSQARPISFFSTVLDSVNVGHLLSLLRVALAFLSSIAITPVRPRLPPPRQALPEKESRWLPSH